MLELEKTRDTYGEPDLIGLGASLIDFIRMWDSKRPGQAIAQSYIKVFIIFRLTSILAADRMMAEKSLHFSRRYCGQRDQQEEDLR